MDSGVEITASCWQKQTEKNGLKMKLNWLKKMNFSILAGYKAALFFSLIKHQT